MIAIVGGGISGLAVAAGLAERGVAVRLFEASSEPGGVMRTVHVGGVPLDLGPQRTRLTEGFSKLVEVAGLESQLLKADEDLPLWVYRRGRLRRVPFSLSDGLTTDLLGWAAKARIALEPFTSGPRRDETVANFFTRKFGRDAYEAMIGPLYGGLYASDPARMLVRHGLRTTLDHFGVRGSLLVAMVARGGRARRAFPTVTFREGMQQLPRALATTLGDSVELDAPVRSIEQADGGWRVRVGEEGSGRGVAADAVVIACPAAEAARLVKPVLADAAARLTSLHSNPLAVVHLRSGFEGRGFGYQVAFGESLETRGATWNASAFGRPGVFTVYLGGMRHPELVEGSDELLGSLAAREFEEVTGASAAVLNVGRTRIPAWDRSWDALEGLELPPGWHVAANWHSRPGITGRLAEASRVVARLAAEASSPPS